MSKLHDNLIEKYGKYSILSSTMDRIDTHYLFDAIIYNNDTVVNADKKVIISGEHIALCSYDKEMNVMVWADTSNTLDKEMVQKIRDIRAKTSKMGELSKYIDKDMSVPTSDEFMKVLKAISDTIGKDILLDNLNPIVKAYVVVRIFTDNR